MRRRRECRPRQLSRWKGLSAQHRRAETDERGRGRRREVTQGPAATGPGGGTGRGVLSLTPLQPRGCALFTPRPSTPRAAPGFPGLPSPPHPSAQPLLLLQGLVHKTVPQVKSLSLGCAPSCALRAAGPYQRALLSSTYASGSPLGCKCKARALLISVSPTVTKGPRVAEAPPSVEGTVLNSGL